MTGKLRLRVRIGTNPDDMQTAWVNVEDRPTEIDSEFWVGRVFVRVRDFDGFTPDGSPPQAHSPYFDGRNRRFHIQAEGRFKKAYDGDSVWFGTQFDHMIKNFPETLFNTGMRIARYIDPAVFYDKNAARPFIMSPFLACVNTLSAWPAPHRAHDAVLTLENGNAMTESDDEHVEDDVPRAETEQSGKSTKTKPIRYWSFVGFREDEDAHELEAKPTQAMLHDEREQQTGEAREPAASMTGSGSSSTLAAPREHSIRTVSTKYDPDSVVVSGHPTHRIALNRLGSYGRDSAVQRHYLASDGARSGAILTPVEDEDTHDQDLIPSDSESEGEEDDNASFHTALEQQWEVHDVLQPDGTIIPVKKKKKGLTVKKVRKSLHIPSAKTVQKNMRSLSIKRKDRSSTSGEKEAKEKKKEKKRSGDSSPLVEGAGSTDDEVVSKHRKSLDLMRPFRFGHSDHSSKHRSSSKTGSRPGSVSDISQVGGPAARTGADDAVSLQSGSTGMRPVPSQTQQDLGANGTTVAPPIVDAAVQTSNDPAPASPAAITVDQAGPLVASGAVANTHSGRGSDALQRGPGSTVRTDSSYTSGSEQSNTRPIALASLQSIETKNLHQQQQQQQPESISSVLTPTSGVSRPGKSKFPSREAGHGHEIRGDELYSDEESSKPGLSHKLDDRLGPWRFSNPSIEPIEDTAFIFGDNTHTVKDRRKHFARSPEVRKLFEFDPDIVYCMSFFLPYMNFNSFDLRFGVVGANLHKYVEDQPVRYMARSSTDEKEVFFMVEFQLEEDTTA
ncbi:hypothetical protein PYCC9005_004306 [Savitreella phatthalungensis]